MKNNDLTNQLLQTNEIISKNNEAIADLRCKDEQNRMALTDGSIRYDAMITQKHSEIVKLQDENQSLRDQLRETEIKLARTSDVISSLRQEGDDGTVAINPPQTEDSSALDKDEERPEMWRVDSLRTEVAASSCEDLAAMNVESELEELCSREENERTREDAETARNDDQLSHGDATIKRPLKDALCTLSGKIYEKIARLRGESRERETENVRDAEQKSKIKDVAPENENERLKQRTKEYADKVYIYIIRLIYIYICLLKRSLFPRRSSFASVQPRAQPVVMLLRISSSLVNKMMNFTRDNARAMNQIRSVKRRRIVTLKVPRAI